MELATRDEENTPEDTIRRLEMDASETRILLPIREENSV